jgi:hypothetical protein
MYEKTILAQKRFDATMGRVTALVTVAVSNKEPFKASGFLRYDGVAADLLRAIVVLMHAAIEDLVRVHTKKPNSFTFSFASDIFNALEKAGYDPSGLEDLRKPLQQFALRRHRIVHYGDLSKSAEKVEPWGLIDIWMLGQWMATVTTFKYKFLEIVTEPNDLFTKRYNLARKALAEHSTFGQDLVKLVEEVSRPLTHKNLPQLKAIFSSMKAKLDKVLALMGEMAAVQE